jgi:poly(3-hydroxybutyrate) depolymerase
MRVAKVLSLAVASATFAACGGRVALYQNVPGVAGGSGVGGLSGSGGAGVGETAGAAGVTLDPRTNDVDAVWPGAGCGRMLPAEQVPTVRGSPKGYTHFTVMGTGANLTDSPLSVKAGPRTFWVRVPVDYDPNRPYRVVYIGQGCGGYKSANNATYALYKEALGGTEQAIYVALDIPEDMANQDCYDNRDGLRSQEWEAFQLFQEFVDAHYCVDLNRIYVAGYSTGSWLANMWGCYFSGWPTPPRKFAPTYHIRAQASYSGGEPPEQPACGGPVAAFWLQDVNDNASPISGNIAALARVGRMDGCATTYDDATLQKSWYADDTRIGNVCHQFVGCPADYPVVFCTTTALGQSSQDGRMIAALKHFFDDVESRGVPAADAGVDAGADAEASAGPVCVPQCVPGVPQCGSSGGLRTCERDATGCPVLGADIPCGPNRVCCATCGPQSKCIQDPGCPVVPASCAGTFCLDATTVATCTVTPPSSSTASACLTVTDEKPCVAGQQCDDSSALRASCR